MVHLKIQQNLENLSREKIDIDNSFNSLYSSKYLYGSDKDNFRIVYDNYIVAYNEVVNVSNEILNKETLIDNVDRVTLNSALLGHKDKLNLFSIEVNKVVDIVALNQSNSLKGDIQQDISDVNDRIDSVLGDIDGAVADSVIDRAEAIVIEESLDAIQKEKLDVDARYTAIYENSFLDGDAKSNLVEAKNEFDEVTWDLIEVITASIEDEKVTDSELNLIKITRESYREKSANLNTRFQEAIDYISKKQVDKAKEDFNKEISDLNGAITDLEDTMNGVFQDGILSETERLSIKQHLLTLASEKSDIDKQYETLLSNKSLEGQFRTDLSTAYNNYVSSYNTLVTAINNILNKDGLIDDVDRSTLNNSFRDHDTKLGLYSTSATNAIDSISQNKAEAESEKVDKKYAEIILDPENGIVSKVEHINTQLNGNGGINQRLKYAEEKITNEGITQVVKDIQYIKDIEAGVETNRQNISEIDQKADSINIKVESKADSSNIISMINVSTEGIKIKADKVSITGFVTFSDLASTGTTTINGSNITTGTINANLANIININASNITTGTLNISDYLNLKGTGTRYTLLAKDNYAVYDGGSSDINRKVVLGFRTVYGGYAPTMMLGYNGTGLHNDSTGATCLTVTHYPMNNNPEGHSGSYGAFSTRVNAYGNYSSLNMYQDGMVKLRSHSHQEFHVENSLKRLQLGNSEVGIYCGNSVKIMTVTTEGVQITGKVLVNGKDISSPVAVFG